MYLVSQRNTGPYPNFCEETMCLAMGRRKGNWMSEGVGAGEDEDKVASMQQWSSCGPVRWECQ